MNQIINIKGQGSENVQDITENESPVENNKDRLTDEEWQAIIHNDAS